MARTSHPPIVVAPPEEPPSLTYLWAAGAGVTSIVFGMLAYLFVWVVNVDKDQAVLKTQITGDLQRMIKDDERAALESLKAQAATEKWQTQTDASIRTYVANEIAEMKAQCAACSRH